MSARVRNSQQMPRINCSEIKRGLLWRVFLLTEFEREFHVPLHYSYLEREVKFNSSEAVEPC